MISVAKCSLYLFFTVLDHHLNVSSCASHVKAPVELVPAPDALKETEQEDSGSNGRHEQHPGALEHTNAPGKPSASNYRTGSFNFEF